MIIEYAPRVIALQETKVEKQMISNDFIGRDYTMLLKSGPRSYWQQGVGIAIRKDIPFEPIELDSNIQAIAVRIHLPFVATIVSIYLPPSEHTCCDSLCDLLQQLEGPVLILGDFNAHHYAWGSKTTNSLGQFIAETALAKRLMILNNGCPTRIDPATGSASALDLAICSECLARKFLWRVVPDTYNSDHFPTMISFPENQQALPNTRKWLYQHADWAKFEHLTSTALRQDIELTTEQFTAIILNAAEKSIPRTSGKSGSKAVPWWNPEVEAAIKQRRKKLRALQKLESTDPRRVNALKAFQESRIAARKIVKKAKQESWEGFVNKISASSTATDMWKGINTLRGKRHYNTPILKQLGGYTDKVEEITEQLAEHYREISATSSYPPFFQMVKEKTEKNCIEISPNTEDSYNGDFAMGELLWALDKGRSVSTGPDSLGYPMLQHLPFSAKTALLEMFNRVWHTGVLPTNWRTGIVVPIPKPNCNEFGPAAFRPITLTSCMAKAFERIVNRRLITELELNGRLDKRQHAFRSGYGVDTYFAELEKSLPNNEEHCLIASLDVSKAYDTTWRYGILRTLQKWKIQGRMLNILQSFLSQRHFQVRIGNYLSRSQLLENGVPQGSVLSVTLFLIAMQPIFQVIPAEVDVIVYADDILLITRARRDRALHQKLQTAVHAVNKWTKNVGYSLSATKSQTIYCSSNARRDSSRNFCIDRVPIPKTKQLRVLGITIDRTLNFRTHCKLTKKACEPRLRILRMIGARTPRAQRVSLLQVGSAIITSRLLYGMGLVSKGGQAVLNILAPIYNQMIRYASGAYVTSPTDAIMAESGSLPFDLLVLQTTSKIAIRILSMDINNRNLPIVQRVLNRLEQTIGVTLPQICQQRRIFKNNWNDPKLSISWDVKNKVRAGDPADKVRPIVSELLATRFHNCIVFYTDGSKCNNSVGSGVYGNGIARSIALPGACSVYSAEAFAIKEALNLTNTNTNIAILTDSASCLAALESRSSSHPWIQEIDIMARNRSINFCWVPGHAGIHGNVQADKLANESRMSQPLVIPIPAKDATHLIIQAIRQHWNDTWFASRDVKLRQVKADTSRWNDCKKSVDQRVLTRLRIGHTRITHSFLLEKTEPPACECCGTPLNVRHIILDCRKYHASRQKFNMKTESLSAVLSNNTSAEENMINFLKETQLYKQL